MKNSILLFFGLTLLLSCASRQRQVWFVETQNAHISTSNKVTRIYLDKQGDFYPTENIYIPYKYFFDPKNEGKTTVLQQTSGNLEHYFTGRLINKQGNSIYWQHYDYSKRANALRSYYKLPKNISNIEAFKQSQAKILDNVALAINTTLSNSLTKTLVILIHGFNDANPSADYAMLRKQIHKSTAQDFVFLEVFWDGLTANQGNPATSKIWGYAQYNSSQIAVTLRKIIKKIHLDTKVRIITHSLGASVATGALFNTTTKWKKPDALQKYTDMVKNISAPEHDIRLGMLAPAIPGVSTFTDFDKRGKNFNQKLNSINKIIVGYNCNDFAVTKRIGNTDWLSRKVGATTLGANYKREVQKTKDLMITKGFDNILLGMSFSQYPCKSKDEEHGLYYYMTNTAKFEAFLKALFL